MVLSQTCNPKSFEDSIYKKWQNGLVGSPEAQALSQKIEGSDTFSIIMPPPNLTGDLHAGHAFQHYLMDTLTRTYRQKGSKTLWYPGVDHAGIQMEGVIGKFLKKEGRSRKELSNEEFLDYTWKKAMEWRDNQHQQSSILGDTPDYSRSLFTLDDRAVDMVNFAFNKYWQDGLIYKGSYLVNWSVGLQTALSDVTGEIEYITQKDVFITFEYEVKNWQFEKENDLKDFASKFLKPVSSWPRVQLGTVRIETKFTDVAIAMHPTKYENYFNEDIFDNSKDGFDSVKAKEILDLIRSNDISIFYHLPPLQSQPLKLVFSAKVDPDFGTGVVKITPGHDQFDYDLYNEMVENSLLPAGQIQTCVTRDGRLSKHCNEFSGMEVNSARLLIIEKLLRAGYISKRKGEYTGSKKIEDLPSNLQDIKNIFEYDIDWDYEHNIAICERSKTPIEPLISEELFLSYHKPTSNRSKTLQELGLEGAKKVNFFTKDFQQQGINFIENIHDWCISRNLTWGHKMPVWYNLDSNPNKKFYTPDTIKGNEDKFVIQADKPSRGGNWIREEKILDTWFSSSLWPLTTLNFHDYVNGIKDTDFETYYPTQVMTTAKEIFYLWICRMIVLGMYFADDIPFQNVVITPTILDEKGKKMSKSLGNGLKPSDAIDKYSSDSLRMGILSGMIPNRNMKFGGSVADTIMEKYRNFGNKVWNIAKFFEYQQDQGVDLNQEVGAELSSASQWILSRYKSVESQLEDHLQDYELAHSINAITHFTWDDFAGWYIEYLKTDKSQLVFAHKLFKQLIVTLSPFMPFEAEVLWDEFFNEKVLLAHTIKDFNWSSNFDTSDSLEFEVIADFVSNIRSIRGLFAIDPATKIEIFTTSDKLLKYSEFVKLLAKADLTNESKDDIYVVRESGYEYSLDIKKYIKDIPLEIARSQKKILSLEKQLTSLEKQLSNDRFIQNASEQIISQKKVDLLEREVERDQQFSKILFLKK